MQTEINLPYITADATGPKLALLEDVQIYPPGFVTRFDKDEDGWVNPTEFQAAREAAKTMALLTKEETAARNELREMLTDLIGRVRELRLGPITFGGNWRSLGPLQLDHLTSDRGWLSLGYTPHPESAAQPSPDQRQE